MEVLFYISPGKILDDVGESQEFLSVGTDLLCPVGMCLNVPMVMPE
jgi:hypothetical protein